MLNLTAPQLLKLEILYRAIVQRNFHEIIIANFGGDNSEFQEGMNHAQVLDELKHSAHNLDLVFNELEYDDALQELREEVRCGGVETNLPASHSRHYEVDAVAMYIFGTWVSWDYYYGGGKHGQPEECEWIDCAKFVRCEQEPVTVIKHTFFALEGTNAT
ncbi:hypothetical protein ACNAUY_07950 [Acinetobacter tibetensis]|uniref:hypothetical protein n=1 Tax=Acinetobacter tibetensis TaxID=2943497 RepID=UPI003A4D6511